MTTDTQGPHSVTVDLVPPGPRPYLCPRCGDVVGHVDGLGCLHVYREPVDRWAWAARFVEHFPEACIVTPHSRATVRCTCQGQVPWYRRET